MPQNPERELTSKSSQTEPVEVGQIVGSFGLKGQVKVQPSTVFLERFGKGERLLINGEWYEIEKSSIHKNRPLLKLKGIGSVEAAEALKWATLMAVGNPELKDGEFLVEDLIGLEVVDQEGRILGPVKEVLNYPAHDLLVVGELLVPLVKEFVKDVDLESRRITVHLIPGMLPE